MPDSLTPNAEHAEVDIPAKSTSIRHDDYLLAIHQDGIAPQEPGPAEHRASFRYKCEGSAEFRTEGFEVRTWARVTDISRSGCYVEMQATSPLHAAVDLLIEVEEIRVRTKGEVKTCYPLLGMGIAFTEMADPDAAQLEKLLSRLGGEIAPPLTDSKPTPEVHAAELLMITDASAALSAVASFFQLNHSLTREQFTQVVGKSQKRD
jgi:hypothetical protein